LLFLRTTKLFSREERQTAIKLRKAKVFLKGRIEKGFGLSKKNPETLVAGCKPGSGRPAVINENI
jgi:hypothetical protein